MRKLAGLSGVVSLPLLAADVACGSGNDDGSAMDGSGGGTGTGNDGGSGGGSTPLPAADLAINLNDDPLDTPPDIA